MDLGKAAGAICTIRICKLGGFARSLGGFSIIENEKTCPLKREHFYKGMFIFQSSIFSFQMEKLEHL